MDIEAARELVNMSSSLYHAAAALSHSSMINDSTSVATKAKAILNEALKLLEIKAD